MLEKAQLLLASFDLAKDAGILVGFSGGADSTALLHFLAETHGKDHIVACHVHHGIRGAEADRDEAFCRTFCQTQGIRFSSVHVDVPALAREQKLSLETAAREARYAQLKTAASANACNVIALAHHLNDYAETFLFNLARGAGSTGLMAIPADRLENGSRLIRPFLSTSKAEIETYLGKKGLSYVLDSTNDADNASRNRIRHHVIPVMMAINPGFLDNLHAASLLIANDDAYITSQADNLLASRLSHDRLFAGDLFSLPSPLRSRMLKRFLSSHGVSVTRSVIASAEGLFSPGSSPSASIDVGNGLQIQRNYAYLSVGKKETAEGFDPISVSLSSDGVYRLSNGLTVSLQRMPFPGKTAASEDTFFLRPYDGTLLIRPRRAGDRFCASGGSKELKKLFIDKKIPRILRSRAPVGEIAGEIAFVYLIGTARPFWVEGDGADSIRVQIKSI